MSVQDEHTIVPMVAFVLADKRIEAFEYMSLTRVSMNAVRDLISLHFGEVAIVRVALAQGLKDRAGIDLLKGFTGHSISWIECGAEIQAITIQTPRAVEESEDNETAP